MLQRLLLAAVLAALSTLASEGAMAQSFVVPSCANTGIFTPLGAGGLIIRDQFGNACTSSGGALASPSPAGAIVTYRVNSVAGTNAMSVKASGGRVYTYTLCNAASAARYVRFFDLATAPVVGTSTPSAGPILVGAGSCQTFTNGIGLAFQNGIALDVTGANGDADTTAIAAGDVTGFIGYQ